MGAEEVAEEEEEEEEGREEAMSRFLRMMLDLAIVSEEVSDSGMVSVRRARLNTLRASSTPRTRRTTLWNMTKPMAHGARLRKFSNTVTAESASPDSSSASL
jgi:hypothetical protein